MRHPFKTLLCALVLASPAVEAASPTAVPKVVTIARVAQFDSLDPVRQNDVESSRLVGLLFDSLLRYRYLAATPQLEPDLLERMPELGADKLTWTFTLRKGVRFHDDPCFPGGQGREMTTDDVLFSMKRFGDARLNSKSWFAIEGAVAGYDAFNAALPLPNGPERFAHFRTMNAILADEIPMIFTYDPVHVGLKQKWLLNYKPSSLSSELICVDVDMALKSRH